MSQEVVARAVDKLIHQQERADGYFMLSQIATTNHLTKEAEELEEKAIKLTADFIVAFLEEMGAIPSK